MSSPPLIHSNPFPPSVIVTNITNATNAAVTTAVPHNFTSGMYVDLYVPPDYGMSLEGTQALITITSPTTFTTNVNTTTQRPFLTPALQAFTPAQAAPASGLTFNKSGRLI